LRDNKKNGRFNMTLNKPALKPTLSSTTADIPLKPPGIIELRSKNLLKPNAATRAAAAILSNVAIEYAAPARLEYFAILKNTLLPYLTLAAKSRAVAKMRDREATTGRAAARLEKAASAAQNFAIICYTLLHIKSISLFF
jgi:hypothetical protein